MQTIRMWVGRVQMHLQITGASSSVLIVIWKPSMSRTFSPVFAVVVKRYNNYNTTYES